MDSINQMAAELTASAQALITLVSGAFALMIGSMFIYSGIKKAIDHSHGHRQGQPTVGPVMINLAIGAILVQLAFAVDVLVASMFGEERQSPNSAMQYMPDSVGGSQMLAALVGAGIWWIAFIGLVAIFRGFVCWNNLANGKGGEDNGWRGWWHILFGTMAVNLGGVLKLFSA